jgi:hypothetical protein
MESPTLENPMKNCFKLQIKKDGPFATLSSKFDSGNMQKAEMAINNTIVITPANDCSGTEFESHSKGWFYFSVSGIPQHTKQKFIIKKMQNLSSQVYMLLNS